MGTEVMTKSEFVYKEITKLFPNAKCELNYSNSHELLIAVMLSAQTTDESVNKVTVNLFKKYKSLEDFAKAKPENLENNLRHLGLFRNKAKNLKNMAKMVIEDFKGLIPKDQKDLEKLPGVGRKTANVYLSEFYQVPRIAVDTHVSRVSKKLAFADKSDNPVQIEKKLMKQFPIDKWIDLHHKLIFFGRYFCKAKNPKCNECPVIKHCIEPILK